MCKKTMSSGAGSRKKIPGAGAAPKQAGSEILLYITPFSNLGPDNILHLVLEGQQMISELFWRPE